MLKSLETKKILGLGYIKLLIAVGMLITVLIVSVPSLAVNKSVTLTTSYKPWARYPNTKVVIPIVATNMVENTPIMLKTVSVFYGDKLLITTLQNKELLPISKKGVTEKEFNQMLNFKKATKEQKEHLTTEAKKIDQDIETIPLMVDLKKVDSSLSVGQKIDLTIEATYIQEGVVQTTVVQTQATIAAALPTIGGWRPGDAHLLSNMSNDNDYPEYSILDIIKMGRDRGLKWLIFTDHAQQLDFSKWGGERATPTTERYGYLDGNIDYEFAYLRGQ
jgi:hypothetical protein